MCFILCRYDRFIDAFEHVANMIDDIYKVQYIYWNDLQTKVVRMYGCIGLVKILV